MSLLEWAQRLGDAFWDRHQRCLAVLLLLDTQTRQWTARVPAQRCAADAAAWRVDGQGMSDLLPTHILGGTMQMRVTHGTADLVGAVPDVDGVHFIRQMLPDARRLLCFVRIGGKPRLTEASSLMFDDWLTMLEIIEPTISLE